MLKQVDVHVYFVKQFGDRQVCYGGALTKMYRDPKSLSGFLSQWGTASLAASKMAHDQIHISNKMEKEAEKWSFHFKRHI